jgi:hypothetical protein
MQFHAGDVPSAVPAWDDIPQDAFISWDAGLPHEVEGGFRRGVVVVAAYETRPGACCGHSSRLLKQE